MKKYNIIVYGNVISVGVEEAGTPIIHSIDPASSEVIKPTAVEVPVSKKETLA